jgi:hypothetical protein
MIPSFDALTDLGAIDPSIVFINFIELLLATSSPRAGKVTNENERNKIRNRKTFRIQELY